MTDPRPGDWTPQRRAIAWLNVVLQAVFLLGFLIVVNLLARQSPKRLDMTSRRSFHLSSVSEDVLKTLAFDVEIWVNPELYHLADDKSLSVAMTRTLDLLDEITRRTSRVTVKKLNAEDQADFARFRKHWTTTSPATLYMLATLGTGRTNTKIVEIQQIYDGNTVTGEVTSFKGESSLIGALRELGGGVKRVVYESEGHQEFLTADKSQMAVLRYYLTTQEGIDLRRIALIDFQGVPADCELLIILGPAQPFQPHEIDILRDYLERGGKVLVAVRPRVRTGIEKLLEEYSVLVGDNIVMDAQQFKPPSQSGLIVRDFNVHDVNRNMVNLGYYLPDCCTVDPLIRKDPYWKIAALAMAGEYSWEEKGETGPGSRPRRDGDERGGNMKLITAVERQFKGDDKKRMKLDVWGSVSPFTDTVLRSGNRPQEVQVQYLVNHFRWLLDKDIMDLKPETFPVRPLLLKDDQLSRLNWVVFAGFPAFGLALGFLAWFVRRK